MKNTNFDPNKETIITVDNLLNVIEGMSKICEIMTKIEGKISEKESKDLMLALVATFICVAQMFPREEQEMIIDMMDKDLGINLREMSRF